MPSGTRKYSDLTVKARRRAVARRANRISEECSDFALHELGFVDDRQFLDDGDLEVLDKNIKALETISKNLKVFGQRIMKKVDG